MKEGERVFGAKLKRGELVTDCEAIKARVNGTVIIIYNI